MSGCVSIYDFTTDMVMILTLILMLWDYGH